MRTTLDAFAPPTDYLPVSVITGFLGSGKTTLLNRLLRHPDMQKSAVVVNEFGEVGIDNLLIESATEDVMIMDGGCVCCTIRGDLVETLANLYEKRQNGEVTYFERVIIETTGLADPAPIIHTLLDDETLKSKYHLDSVLSTVDCVYAQQQFEEFYETVKQAAVADRVILTKTDLVKPEVVEQVKLRLNTLNPGAMMLESVNGNVDVKQLFSAGLYNPTTKSLDVQQWLQAEAYHEPHTHHHEAHHDHGHHEHHHHHHEGQQFDYSYHDQIRHDEYIQSFCLEYDKPLAWKTLNMWFQQLTALRGKDLLRIKGLVYTEETELPVVVQGVQHIFQPPTTLDKWPKPQPLTQIVFITRNIQKAVLEKMLDILVKSKTPAEACQATLVLMGYESA
ncbi:GTP-binding protein [Candidatus Albibeggiatoa sp. nov. NOAA]|uniref:CobW family GTP-binding protein n=1 Tax=Candidatus Albibeggiatoa sp. nov. NOAA TaxID=3162724 RepID=UPI0032FFFCCC|nr:GTP-binding protein [Thiotrichaceae bacterium]